MAPDSSQCGNDEAEIIYPRLERVRFHNLRHTAVTVLGEAGLPDRTIMAQVGHISPEMLQTYCHIRRQASNAAAAAVANSNAAVRNADGR
jgi:integrase